MPTYKQSNQIAKSKPMDDIHNETGGHTIPSLVDFHQKWLPTVFPSLYVLASPPIKMWSMFFHSLCLGWTSVSPTKCGRNGILGLLSPALMRP